MWLTKAEQRLLYEALLDAFPRVQDLRRMVSHQCEQRLDDFTEGTLEDRLFQLIQRADSRNWLFRLVDGAYRDNPDNVRLSTFHKRLNATRGQADALERVVKQARAMQHISALREAIERAEYQVCRVLPMQ
jgi:hypothetical protein